MVSQRTSRDSEPRAPRAAEGSAEPDAFPLRVERALRYIPRLDALGPLRVFLYRASELDERSLWGSSGPYLTVGKRVLNPALLRRRLPQVLDRVRDHLAGLYEAVLDALESEQRGDEAGAVGALLRAGESEERVGRFEEARQWYELAVELGEELRERAPEIEALRRLGYLSAVLGRYDDAARCYQRSLVLAEAEIEQERAVIVACQGLGNVALAQGAWEGAESWYRRGLELAEAAGDRLRTAQLHHNLGIVARRKGELSTAARRVQEARAILEELGEREELARLLNSQGLWEVELGRPAHALAAYEEALALIEGAGGNPGLEVTVRINLAQLHTETDRFLEAEDEARAAEKLALAHGLTHRLPQIYAVIGKMRGRQDDELGFVFFEKALELCRTENKSPLVNAQIYFEYGVFRARLGHAVEARVQLERAREILETMGSVPELRQVTEELERLPR